MSPRLSIIRLSKSFVCPRCQLRPQERSISVTSRLTSEPISRNSQSPVSQYTRLTNRSVIKLKGPEAAEFLQGLVPAKVTDRTLGISGAPIYTAFLSAQGRISHDVFIYPPRTQLDSEDVWYIEADNEAVGDLLKHLKKHKLRSKFAMQRISPDIMSIYYLWPASQDMKGSKEIGGPDPRPSMGSRWIISPDSASETFQETAGEPMLEMPLQDYTIHRMLNGIAEGQEEIIALAALPQESNVDFFGGIDFHKGCYLGQELTIRTHHTGVVRKRILPCQIYDSNHPIKTGQEEPIYDPDSGLQLPPPGSNIAKLASSSKRSTGKWLGGVGNIGLALCRLEMMTDLSVSADPSTYDPMAEFKVKPVEGSIGEQLVKAFVPPWLRTSIEESKLKRTRKRPKEEEDGDDAID